MNLGRSIRTEARECPVCGELLDGATQVNGDGAPSPGDVTVCLYCAAPLRFTATGFDVMAPAEVEAVERESPEFRSVRAAVLEVRTHGRP